MQTSDQRWREFLQQSQRQPTDLPLKSIPDMQRRAQRLDLQARPSA